MALCAESQLEHIVRANQADGIDVDVFVHSWNSEAASELSESYAGPWLGAQLHEPPQFEDVVSKRGRKLKREAIHKARSQALSIGRVASLARKHEEARGIRYAAVLVIRLDMVVGAPALVRPLLSPPALTIKEARGL